MLYRSHCGVEHAESGCRDQQRSILLDDAVRKESEIHRHVIHSLSIMMILNLRIG